MSEGHSERLAGLLACSSRDEDGTSAAVTSSLSAALGFGQPSAKQSSGANGADTVRYFCESKIIYALIFSILL